MTIDVKYDIDDSVPVPVRRKPSVPISKLEVGQSILFPKDKRAVVASNASRLKERYGKEYTIRTVDEANCRIWRVS